MVIFIMAFLGCVFIGLAIYFFTQGSFKADTTAKSELETANKKIQILNQELSDKNNSLMESENKIKSESFTQVAGQNMPILEITSVDLGEGETVDENQKKIHKLLYSHQIRFSILNIGKSALKDVIFSIKDIYNDPKIKRKNNKITGKYEYVGKSIDIDEIGSYDNIEVNTLNLKSKKMVYSSNLPSSFGVGDYSYYVIVEWNNGSYQTLVNIEEIDGKLKFKYEYYDVSGKPIDFKNLEKGIIN